MSGDAGHRTGQPAEADSEPCHEGSGLSGFGGRPALHPAWCAPTNGESRANHSGGVNRTSSGSG